MRREFASAALALAATLASGSALAGSSLKDEIDKGTSSQPVVAAPDPVAGVATQIAPTQVDLAAAAVSTKEKGTEFKATFVPAKLFDSGYVDVLSESKFVLTSDGSLTRIGYGVAYNPFALRSKRAAEIATSVLHTNHCGANLADAFDALNESIKPLKEAVDRAKWSLGADETALAEAEKALQAIQAGADQEGPKARRAAATAKRDAAKVTLDQAQTMLDTTKTKGEEDANAALDKCNSELTADEWRKINSGWMPLISANIAVDVYPSGKAPDPVDKTKTARLEPFGGVRIDGGFTFKPQERLSLELWGQYRRGRTTGDPKTELATYVGGGVTASAVAWAFLPDFTKSADYVQTGFIPGLVIGASGQYSKCSGREHCDKMRTESMSLTPFVDIRIKSALQFRLSTPITKFTAVSDKGTDVAPTLTIASAFAAL
jgi:hypothetical protein